VRSLTATGRLLFGAVFVIQIVLGGAASLLALATSWGGGLPAIVQNGLWFGGLAVMGTAAVGFVLSVIGHESSRTALIASTVMLVACGALSLIVFN